MKWIKDNIGMLLSILLVAFTIAIFGSMEMYLANSGEFWFPLCTAITISIILFVAIFVVLSLIGAVLVKKNSKVYSAIVLALGIAMYIQANYVNINYGTLDGNAIDWGAYPVYAVLDTLGWVLIFAVVLFLYFKKNEIFIKIQKVVPLFIVGIQIATLGVLFIASDVNAKKSDYYLSTEGMYEVSDKENIIVFVLDAFDDAFWQTIYQDEAEKYEDIFEDFTYFDNASVASARTKMAMPSIITGEAYPGEVLYSEYIKEAFNKDGLYDELKKQNYNVGIYVSPIWVPDESEDLVDNQVSTGYEVDSYSGLSKKYLDLMLYEHLPHTLKKYFWMYTSDFDSYKKGTSAESFVADDSKFLGNLDLKINEQNNCFRLIYLNGAHAPYRMDENGRYSDQVTSLEQQAKGSLFIVNEYISQMKALGVYENSTIIIMADHGEANIAYDHITETHGILFVKEKGDSHNFEINPAPVSYFDIHPTILSELGVHGKETVFDIDCEKPRERFFYKYQSKGGSFITYEYSIIGDIDDESNIKKTGRTFAPVVEIDEYKFGDKLMFGIDSTVSKYIVSGVAVTDEAGNTWTDAKKCKFRIPLKKMPKNNMLVTFDVKSVQSSLTPQEITIFANSVFCYQTVLKSADKLQFVIPKEVIANDKMLDLDIYLPDATATKYDGRILALDLNGLCIEETKEEPTAITNYINIGDTVLLSDSNEAAEKYFAYGFSHLENSFTWTEAKAVKFLAFLATKVEQDVMCTVKLGGIMGNAQNVIVLCNEQEVFAKEITKGDKEITFVIPKDSITEGRMALKFMLPDAISPYELGISTDGRALGLAITEIVFSNVEGENN